MRAINSRPSAMIDKHIKSSLEIHMKLPSQLDNMKIWLLLNLLESIQTYAARIK